MKLGYRTLDRKVEIPERSIILVISPQIPAKLELLSRFLKTGSQKGEPGIFVTTDRLPSEIRERLGEAPEVAIVDCVSWSVPDRRERDVFQVPGPAALNELSVAIERARESVFKPGKPMRMVFDSVSTLLLYTNPNTIFRFVQVIANRARASFTTLLLTLQKDMHEPKVVSTLEHLTDGTAELREERGKVYIKFSRLFETGWVELE